MQSTYGVGEYTAGQAAVTCQSRSAIGTRSTRRAAIGVHAGGGNALTAFSDAATRLLADCGYPTHVGDYGGSTYKINGAIWNWGNSDCTTAIAAGVAWMATQGAKTDKVFVYGGSMGAAGAMNYAKANLSQIGAIALSVPLLDLNELSSNDRGSSVAGLGASTLSSAAVAGTATLNLVSAAAFSTAGLPGVAGFAGGVNVVTVSGMQAVSFTGTSGNQLTGVSGLTANANTGASVTQGYGASLVNSYGVTWPALLSGAQLSANSPIVWAQQAGGLTVPVKIWSSDNDPVASNTAACRAFAAAVLAAGDGNVAPIVQSLGSVGHLAGAPPVEVVQWFDANGGRA